MLLYLIWHQAKLHSMDVAYKYGDIKHVAEGNDSGFFRCATLTPFMTRSLFHYCISSLLLIYLFFLLS